MQDRLQSNRAVFEQRTAQLEVQLRRFFAFLNQIPLQRWQWLAMLLLVIGLSHSLARLLWLVVPTPEIPPASVSLLAAEIEVTSTAADAVDIAQLKSLTPFGNLAEAPPVEQTQVASDIEANTDTQLNLVLRGVIGSSTETAARAIIVAGDKADVYAVGDTLPEGNNVTLAKVLDIRVIINNNGNFESLWMYKDDPNAPKLTTGVYAPPAAAVNRQQGSLTADNNPVYDSPSSTNPSGEPSMAEVNKTLADVVAMSIYREGGQVVGYKIRPGRNAAAFDSLGLQTDDIVTAVNGVPLSTPGKIMEIYKSMGSATSANLEIRRGGSTVNLDVMLK